MLAILTGFAVILLAVFVGWLCARINLLGPDAQTMLIRLSFNVLSPMLLFALISEADLANLFSTVLPIAALSAVAVIVIFAVIARVAWGWRLRENVIGSLSSGYVNANNFGIPIAAYMLGDATHSAPIILLQLLLFAPLALGLLGASADGRATVGSVLKSTIGNPIIIGSALGFLVALLHIDLPEIVTEPIASIGHAAVPIMLIAFGMSLHGQQVLAAGSGRRAIVLSVVLKLTIMPLVAYAIARWGFRLDDHGVFAATAMAALPTAQNAYTYAHTYRVGEIHARDSVAITTLSSLPVLFVIALVLGPR